MPSVVPAPAARAGWRPAVLALVLALVLAVLAASPAEAHNTLRSTDPADGSTVPAAPAQVTLTFDQPAMELGTQVVVTAPDGVVVSDGPVRLVDSSVVQPLVETLPAGAYTVDWRVTSADGHPLSGTFGFTATAASPVLEPAPADPAPTEGAADATPTPEEPAADEPTDVFTATATPPVALADDDGVPAWVWVVLAVGVLAALAGGGAALAARRRAATSDGPGSTDADGPSER
ncbi:copper resistance protein CopC [Cellulomonas sp. zg-ZUI222]|uniref:Copper resistance protein CopC n=1 Tax=Cellulomonas wangleii TaxID=2816956 RepID=A0ABX8D419_9CELL|nr:copper resistance CopC family protein [Cellulomonas wangleii]MBO0919689.1 copper resistance protein CopC [Cellulomonas wangleii]MBO0923884.1 copper resistance protein CopC [Cellulomonas wangleii]MBO0924166.1 copper resistance protein CopC [Cellulomonas wangleii]QVI62188.1 copper resistance protein CopC [Cellulomonas wangleii]